MPSMASSSTKLPTMALSSSLTSPPLIRNSSLYSHKNLLLKRESGVEAPGKGLTRYQGLKARYISSALARYTGLSALDSLWASARAPRHFGAYATRSSACHQTSLRARSNCANSLLKHGPEWPGFNRAINSRACFFHHYNLAVLPARGIPGG